MMRSSRKRNAPVRPLATETADPGLASAAASAAASAYMRRELNRSLSSAAAAAALRARPTTPTIVADVESKRVRRRNSSVPVTTTYDVSLRGGMKRTPSAGSMTGRTFRAASPGLSPAPKVQVLPAPLSSSLSARYTQAVAPPGTRSMQAVTPSGGGKEMPLQTQSFQTRTRKTKDGKDPSFRAPTSRDLIPAKDDLESFSSFIESRLGSPSPSINFSYPRAGQRPQNESASPSLDQELVYDPNSRRLVPRGELASRLGGDRLPGSPARVKHKRPKEVQDQSSNDTSTSSRGDGGGSKRERLGSHRNRAKGAPQIVLSHHEDESPTSSKRNDGLELGLNITIPSSKAMPLSLGDGGHGRILGVDEENRGKFQSKDAGKGPPYIDEEPKLLSGPPRDHVESPRSARFASSADEPVFKHEPPPRCLSPRKSALKLSNTSRGLSPAPSNEGSETSGLDATQRGREDSAMARKKSARVSWDDQGNAVVGESSKSPATASPSLLSNVSMRTPWHSIMGKYSRADSAPAEEEETMSPRPALPLFGSVREKKTRGADERPLIRPYDSAGLPDSRTTPAIHITDAGAESGPATRPPSGQPARNAANISKYREPLSPSSASKGADLEDSDDLLNSDEDMDGQNLSESASSANAQSTSPAPRPNPPTFHLSTAAAGNAQKITTNSFLGDIDINLDSISEDIPTLVLTTQPQSTESTSSNPVLVMHDIKEEEEEEAKEGEGRDQEAEEKRKGEEGRGKNEKRRNSDQESVYSDAYEDWSTFEGDGFMSMNAVLEAHSQTKDLTGSTGREFILPRSRSRRPSQVNGDWENAKAYWRSLSSDERRRLEKEALEEGDDVVRRETDGVPGGGKLKAMEDLKRVRQNENQRAQQPRYRPPESVDSEGKAFLGGDGTQEPATMQTRPRFVAKGPQHRANRQKESIHESSPNARRGKGRDRQGESLTPPESSDAEETEMLKYPRLKRSSAGQDVGHVRSAVKPAGNRPLPQHRSHTVGESRSASQGALVDDIVPRLNAGVAASLTDARKRRGSDSGESSFGRAKGGSGRYRGFSRVSMRGSMRGTALSEGDKPSSSSFRLRSSSPADSAFGCESVSSVPSSGRGRLHQSLRRGLSSSGSRSRIFTSGRKTARLSRKTRKEASRFADSSDDEDDRHPALFRSRFEDSSDEEDLRGPKHKAKERKSLILPRTTASSGGTRQPAIASRSGQNQHNDKDKNAPLNLRQRESRGSRGGRLLSKLRPKGRTGERETCHDSNEEISAVNTHRLGDDSNRPKSGSGPREDDAANPQWTDWPLLLRPGDENGDDSETLHQSCHTDEFGPPSLEGAKAGTGSHLSPVTGQQSVERSSRLGLVEVQSTGEEGLQKKKFRFLRKVLRLEA